MFICKIVFRSVSDWGSKNGVTSCSDINIFCSDDSNISLIIYRWLFYLLADLELVLCLWVVFSILNGLNSSTRLTYFPKSSTIFFHTKLLKYATPNGSNSCRTKGESQREVYFCNKRPVSLLTVLLDDPIYFILNAKNYNYMNPYTFVILINKNKYMDI